MVPQNADAELDTNVVSADDIKAKLTDFLATNPEVKGSVTVDGVQE